MSNLESVNQNKAMEIYLKKQEYNKKYYQTKIKPQKEAEKHLKIRLEDQLKFLQNELFRIQTENINLRQFNHNLTKQYT